MLKFQISVKYDTKTVIRQYKQEDQLLENIVCRVETRLRFNKDVVLFNNLKELLGPNIFKQFGDWSKDVLSGWVRLMQNAGSICAIDIICRYRCM